MDNDYHLEKDEKYLLIVDDVDACRHTEIKTIHTIHSINITVFGREIPLFTNFN